MSRRAYAALLPLTGQRWSHRTQCHSSVVLAPLIVVSCLTVPTPPHDGHTGGTVDLMELSGMDPITLCYHSPCSRRSRRCDHRWPHVMQRNHSCRLPGLFAGSASIFSLSQLGQVVRAFSEYGSCL